MMCSELTVYCYTGTSAEALCKRITVPYVVLPLLADYNADGSCSIADAVWLMQALTESDMVAELATFSLDCNNDALFDLADVQAYLNGLVALANAPV